MGVIDIFHHRLLRSAVWQALGQSKKLTEAQQVIRRHGLYPIEIQDVNRQWLQVVDRSNYFNPFTHELYTACREALLGVVDMPLLCLPYQGWVNKVRPFVVESICARGVADG